MIRYLLFIAAFVSAIFASILPQINTSYAQVITESKENGTEIHYTYGNDLVGDGTHYFLTDALGSTRGLVDSSESLTDSYDYHPYGELSSHDGNATSSFLFTGEQFEGETNNYYLRARYYSPSLTRFLSRDTYDGQMDSPITLNHYHYGASNPIMFIDLSGHENLLTLTASLSIMETLSTSSLFVSGVAAGYITYNLFANKIAYISPRYEDQSADPGNTNPIPHFYLLASPTSGTGSLRYDFDVEPRVARDAMAGKKVVGFVQKSSTSEYAKNFVRLSPKQYDAWEWMVYGRYPHDDNDPSKVLKYYNRNWINCLSYTISGYSSAMVIMLTVPSL